MDRTQLHLQKLAKTLADDKIDMLGRIAGQEANLCQQVWAYLSVRGSLRKTAKELGISAAYLSDVSRCKRNVSAELLKRVLAL